MTNCNVSKTPLPSNFKANLATDQEFAAAKHHPTQPSSARSFTPQPSPGRTSPFPRIYWHGSSASGLRNISRLRSTFFGTSGELPIFALPSMQSLASESSRVIPMPTGVAVPTPGDRPPGTFSTSGGVSSPGKASVSPPSPCQPWKRS